MYSAIYQRKKFRCSNSENLFEKKSKTLYEKKVQEHISQKGPRSL